MTSSRPITEGMELIRWTLEDQRMLHAIVIRVFGSRWWAVFDFNPLTLARLPRRGSFSECSSVDILLTSLGIRIGAHGYRWREPRRYGLKRAFVDQTSTQHPSYARLRLDFTHSFFPPGGTPLAIDVPIVEELVPDVIELVPTLKTLGNPPDADSWPVKKLRR